MAKNSVRDFDATAANNTDIQSVDIAENCAPSGINNAIRELMADIKDVSAGTVALESPQADSMTVTGDLTVDTNTLKVDSTNNRVGVGTTSSTRTFATKSSSVTIANFESTSGTAGLISFSDSNTTDDVRVRAGAVGDNLVLQAGGAERMRILSGGGLTFNGDTSANNALDDYEIGSWSPTYSISGGSFNMSLQLGTYVKVGEIVTATARVRGQRVGGSGTLTVTGLPYSTRNIANVHAAISIGYTNGWAVSPQAGFTATNGTTISFKKNGSSTNPNSNLVDDITASDVNTSSTSNNDIIFSVTYVAN